MSMRLEKLCCNVNDQRVPDEFNFTFHKNNWETMKEDILPVIYNFEATGKYLWVVIHLSLP